jgi:hypothetical protein
MTNDEQRCRVSYLDGLQGKVNVLRKLQSATEDELSALLPSAEGETIGRGV